MDQAHDDKTASEQDKAEFLTCMVENVRDYAIFLLDAGGTIRSWNKAAEVMKGFTAMDAIGSHLGLLYTDEDREAGRPQHNLALAAENGTYQEETWRRKKDGGRFWAMIELIAIKNPDGELKGFCKITRDIGVRKSLMEQLAAEKERAQVTLGAIGEAVISVDTNGKVDYLNATAERLTGWRSADALGRPFSEVFHAVDEVSGESQEHQLITWLQHGRLTPQNSPAVLLGRDGTQYAIEDTATAICLPDGQTAGGVIVFRDVTASRQQQRATAYRAAHDALTGLVNRSEFENRLQRSLEHASHGHFAGALLFMDLDQFKIVNDACGHQAGDRLLNQLAAVYLGKIRDRDTLARLGGDEFALIADHCSLEEAYAIANKILQATRDFQFVCKDRIFKVGVSIGLVSFDETVRNIQELLQLADHACYAAKAKGRGQIVCQRPGETAAAQRKDDIDWPSRLGDAMRQGRLQLHYQPIVDASGASGLRYEVLVRLADPHEGVILPERFLPAAERHALMPTIDRWVIEQVLHWLEANPAHAEKLELCVINLSPTTLMDESFLAHVAGLLPQFRIGAEKLCFEVTESAVVADMRKSLAMVDGLHAIGCKVSLDHFGKGMASFQHLKRLPADFVKIDTELVSAVTHSAVDEEMVKSVNDIAHLMGKKTIALCVEDQATADVLSRIGIDYVQGHWIAPPAALAGSVH
ncbi:MAG TPA: EAL domain-containing protein [Noviherbaspirillum sp.]|uniref:EAL domain-containing protein n=1 Tax=Noviherbaspirillum sp. TaxID=1926288 RepID=UPI002D6DE37C|nr:EAL domain-containing protein [Noviherbaspirillum sp.]HYD95327.1 EAL domain-containing protein [Noviherbaspirillum sp.]